MPYRLAYNPILWRHFLSWRLLLSDDSNLCQVYLKLANTQPWNRKSQENTKDEVSQTLTIVPRNNKFTDRKSERLKRIMTTWRVDFPSKWGQATTKARDNNYKMDGYYMVV